MDQVSDRTGALTLQEDKVDACVDPDGTDVDASVGTGGKGDPEGTDVDASVDVCGAHKPDAKTISSEETSDIAEAGSDHGAASTDARVMGCFGSTDSRQKASNLPIVSQTLDVYSMDHKYRGHALIINNEKFSSSLREQGLGNRDGTGVDERTMNRRLNDLGFTVTGYHDLKASRMINVCSQMGAKNHSECDCFICVILSHGEEGVVYGTDKSLEIKELVKYFKGDVCPTLVGKPKIFIIQACRGYQTDPGVTVNVVDAKGKAPDSNDRPEAEPPIVKLPIEADFLFAYSTIPGYYSWRNGMNGSWFIQALSEVLKDFGKSMEIRKILTLVNKKVAQNFQSFNPDNKDFHKMKQIPCITSMLTKDLYFSTTKKKRIMQYT